MLWNCDFLYVAMPRTGSMSLNMYFSQTWQPPVFGKVSLGHLKAIAEQARPSPFITQGRGSENLRQALDIAERGGRFLRNFKAVIFVVRDPYEMARSSYRFLRAQYESNKENPRSKLAHENDFEGFCAAFEPPDFEKWVTDAEGQWAPNLRFMRLENLAEDVRVFNAEFNIRSDLPLPHANTLAHSDTAGEALAMTGAAEAHIYEKYRFIFDLGGYSRRMIGDHLNGARG